MVIEVKEAILTSNAMMGEWRPEIRDLIEKPTPLHRFADKMSDYFWSAVQRIATTTMRAMLRAFGQRIRRALRWCTAFWSSAAWVQKSVCQRTFSPAISRYRSRTITQSIFRRTCASAEYSADLDFAHLALPSTSSPKGEGAAFGISRDHGPAKLGDWQELV